jgi:hypothetical protein
VSAQSIKHSWVKHLIVGLLAPVFVLLSGPVFFCKCDRQVVTMSQLKTSAECCAAHCEGEPDPSETEDGCPKDPNSPCNEEIELVFAHPDGAGGQLQGSVPAPLEAYIPGDSLPDLAQTLVLPRVESLDSHPPPGSGRLHLHFQILLI